MGEKDRRQASPAHPIREIEQPPIKITPENLDKALKILREVLEESQHLEPASSW